MLQSRDGGKSNPNSPSLSMHSGAEQEDDTDQDHENDNEEKPGSGLRKKRIQQACRPCGIKRVKCDGAMPCATCLKVGEPCQYGQPKKRGPPKGSTRGGSKASKLTAVPVKGVAERRDAEESSRALPFHQSTNSFAPMYNVANSGLPPPQLDNRHWPRPTFSAGGAGPSSSLRHIAAPGMGSYPADTYGEHFPAFSTASPEANSRRSDTYRVDSRSHRDFGARGDTYGPTESAHYGHATESFYRGGSSGHSFLRPLGIMNGSEGERRLPALDLRAGRTTSAAPSPGRSEYPSHFDLTRAGSKTSHVYRRRSPPPSPAASKFDPAHRDYDRPAETYPASVQSSYPQQHPLSAQPSHQTWPSSATIAGVAPVPSSSRSSGTRLGSTSDEPLLVDGTLLQMHKDQRRTAPLDSAARSALSDDPVLDPLLWVKTEDAASGSFEPLGVTLTRPVIPLLIQERLFTIFWGIVQTIWPALYKPALCLTGFNIIDPEKHPMLHNAACALAAAAWDSGEAGLSEQDTEATQSDWVERTASDLSFSQGATGSSKRLSAANLGDILLVRAKYYLIKINNEPSLEAIQSLLFMALREGGNGRASQASAYQSTACRMAIDLGLHRKRDYSSLLGLQFTHAEEQARSRIFWCLYLLDKTSSATLGRPVVLRDIEIDCPLPSIDEADEKETWAETTNNSSLIRDNARDRLLKTPIAAMTHLRSGIRLGQICERIIGMYTEVKSDEIDAEDTWDVKVGRIHQTLVAWESQLPRRLRFEEPAHRLPNTLSQHLWFQVCKVILHRPYILKTSNKSGLPSSLKVCTEAVGKICDILTAYENNFGMRKLSSTFTYCIFTASTIEIANTTSTDPVVAIEAKRRLKKFMTWLNRIAGSWKSATHHLQILEQLGHGIDADLDGTGLPRRGAVGLPTDGNRPNSPSSKPTNLEMHSLAPSFPQIDSVDQPHNDLPAHSVPGPIGAPMNISKSRSGFTVGLAMQDDLHAQFQAQGQNPGQLFGLNAPATGVSGVPHRPVSSSLDDPSDADTVAAATAAFGGVGIPEPPQSEARPQQISPGASLKLHDTSYWGAMPLASEDTLSWANFTNSYLEALNSMTGPPLHAHGSNTDTGTGSIPTDMDAVAYSNGNLGMDSNLASRINGAMTRPQTALDYGRTT